MGPSKETTPYSLPLGAMFSSKYSSPSRTEWASKSAEDVSVVRISRISRLVLAAKDAWSPEVSYEGKSVERISTPGSTVGGIVVEGIVAEHMSGLVLGAEGIAAEGAATVCPSPLGFSAVVL